MFPPKVAPPSSPAPIFSVAFELKTLFAFPVDPLVVSEDPFTYILIFPVEYVLVAVTKIQFPELTDVVLA